jgi:large subunit ribosomal protein L21
MAQKSTYAVIAVGGKQYRVREGERLLVDRVSVDEGKTFHPDLLMLGGDGDPTLGDKLKGAQVTAKVAAHVLGEKVIVGKHKRRTGYRRRNGHRSRLTQIEIQSIGTRGRSPSSTARKEAASSTSRKEGSTSTAAKKTTAASTRKRSTTTKKKAE